MTTETDPRLYDPHNEKIRLEFYVIQDTKDEYFLVFNNIERAIFEHYQVEKVFNQFGLDSLRGSFPTREAIEEQLAELKLRALILNLCVEFVEMEG